MLEHATHAELSALENLKVAMNCHAVRALHALKDSASKISTPA